MTQQSTVLVLGASRGLGFALAKEWLERGWHVIATVRSPSSELKDLGARFPGSLEIETVDIANADSVKALRDRSRWASPRRPLHQCRYRSVHREKPRSR